MCLVAAHNFSVPGMYAVCFLDFVYNNFLTGRCYESNFKCLQHIVSFYCVIYMLGMLFLLCKVLVLLDYVWENSGSRENVLIKVMFSMNIQQSYKHN